MDEEAWLTAKDPQPMLEFLQGRASDRKLRLFACGCVRRVWDLLADEKCRTAVEVTERFADSLATPDELDRAYHAAASYADDAEAFGSPHSDAAGAAGSAACPVLVDGLFDALADAAASAVTAACTSAVLGLATSDPVAPIRVRAEAKSAEQAAQAALLRDLVANPFAPPPHLDPAWLQWQDATVLRMATAIYKDRAFDRMPVLAPRQVCEGLRLDGLRHSG